jgi:hypothetical protein
MIKQLMRDKAREALIKRNRRGIRNKEQIGCGGWTITCGRFPRGPGFFRLKTEKH